MMLLCSSQSELGDTQIWEMLQPRKEIQLKMLIHTDNNKKESLLLSQDSVWSIMTISQFSFHAQIASVAFSLSRFGMPSYDKNNRQENMGMGPALLNFLSPARSSTSPIASLTFEHITLTHMKLGA
ncbi:unnamed protein product [Orchesella dallaii]|uniref:Uncharacterized protein n=1 Tax=Orchesella dallaii TaxID=48710 RepID=A0ABP1RSF6_9HEXA